MIFDQIRHSLSKMTVGMEKRPKYTNKNNKNVDNEIERYHVMGNMNAATSNDFLSTAGSSSDSESLFIPRQSSDSLNASPVPSLASTAVDVDSSLCYLPTSTPSIMQMTTTKSRKFDREKEQLVEKHREETRRQNILHKIQIDTIVRSMARRHSKKMRPFLTPSPELYNASTRMGQTEFLKSCIDRVEYLKE